MTEETEDGGFRRVYELLSQLVDAIEDVRRRHAMVITGSDIVTLVAIEGDERNLDWDVHRLQRQLEAHDGN